MTSGAKALKKAHNDMDVDKVHDMLDEIADQQEVANQIGDAISNPVAFGQEFDEDELEASDGSVNRFQFFIYFGNQTHSGPENFKKSRQKNS